MNSDQVDKQSMEYFLRRMQAKDLEMAYELHNSVSNHLDSFNLLYEGGLAKIVQHLQPLELTNEGGRLGGQGRPRHLPFSSMKVWLEDLSVGYPTKTNDYSCHDVRLFPSECRLAGKTYNAPLLGTVVRQVDGQATEKISMNLGEIPIMVRSKHCHLHNLKGKQMVRRKEDSNEFGGYFVLNGLEKLIRMLIIQKRNYPVGFIRNSYMNRAANFTGYAVQMRSVREDLYARTITLHYLSDGGICARLLHRKQEFLIPLICILRALVPATDQQVLRAVQGHQHSGDDQQIIKDRLEMLLKGSRQLGILSQQDNLKYLGSNFRMMLSVGDSQVTDEQVGNIFLREHILVNLEENIEKFNTLCLMARKLYLLSAERVAPDNLDSLNTQEVLLPGHLYLMVLREKLEELLQGIQQRIMKDSRSEADSSKIMERGYLKKAVEQQSGIGKKLEYFLATGNLRSQTGLDLMQQNGFVVQADKINNMRFLANFRSIHRGAYFTEMKTTTVRKLLPEQWGFICPVHTPDGSPCGLLNHLSMKSHAICKPILDTPSRLRLEHTLVSLGMLPATQSLLHSQPPQSYFVLFDGKVCGYVPEAQAQQFVESLRYLKIKEEEGEREVPEELEVVLVQRQDLQKQPIFPGIYLNSNEARLIRPVKHLASRRTEWISPFEQLLMSIACLENDLRDDTTHMEYSAQHMLSILASNVPLLVHNQSPRNMYQCQMAKQTLGIPYHNGAYRLDNKSFVYNTPQVPLVKPDQYEQYGMTDYPSGVNAVVAVIAYTGYDMEDAMIINKSAYDRGFAHASVYKSKRYQLNEEKGGAMKKNRFKAMTGQTSAARANHLDHDGMAPVGTLLRKGEAELQVWDQAKQEAKTMNYKDQENSRLEQVCLYGQNNTDFELAYKFRYQRNPIIGDKFSSRHGQKGVLSTLLPQIDMPFTEQGLTPDIIINPNAFPSRMTIGMLIESLAAKQGAMDGTIHTTVPFEPYENDDATGYFGKQLTKHGYRFFGTETMYSGFYGIPMKCEIYLGIVYYQRLRHMVSDKYQARANGPVDILTQQPVKGRKKHGGIRLGEMERDALLAHGVSFILHDRLMNCSDYSQAYVCSSCGDILSSYLSLSTLGAPEADLSEKSLVKQTPKCSVCPGSECKKVAIPFVLRYLTNELAAMNIKMTYLAK